MPVRKSIPYRSWWFAPIFGRPEGKWAEGCPDVIVAFDIEHAFRVARTHWPTAEGWICRGRVDPCNPETCRDSPETGMTRFVVDGADFGRSLKKLTYWVCTSLAGSGQSVRALTKKGCLELREASGRTDFQPPKKVTLTYKNPFDLLRKVIKGNRIE